MERPVEAECKGLVPKGRFRDQEMKLGRRAPSRDPRHRILVVCEGKKTEPLYLKAFQHHVRNRLVHVEIVGEGGVPLTAVARAIALRDAANADARSQRDDNLRFDEAWCVIDVDEHPNLEEACKEAERSAIMVAVSNPCFELWALLHFREHVESWERHEIQKALKAFLPGYEKELDFRKMAGGYSDAVDRARELSRIAEQLGQLRRNPSTGVYVLTERIKSVDKLAQIGADIGRAGPIPDEVARLGAEY